MFESLELYPDSRLYGCCPVFVKYQNFGNIFNQSVEEILNGDKAKQLRQSIIDGSFKYCNLEMCVSLGNIKDNNKFIFSDEYWQSLIKGNGKIREVRFNLDYSCNVRCIMCRDTHQRNQEQITNYENIIDSKLLHLLKDTETVALNGSGEVFASNLYKKLIPKITSKYPKIKFDILTNGLLANKETIEKFGLEDKIEQIEISVHASKKETYEKIVRGGDWGTLLNNIKYFIKLKNAGKIICISLAFVVSVYNYKELIPFQKFANRNGLNTIIWEYRKWGTAELDKNYEKVAVFEPYHPEYPQFKEIIGNKIFDSPNCNINSKLRPLV